MNDNNDLPNALPESLRGIVDGMNADPIPSDLKEELRSRLDNQLKPRLQRPKRQATRYAAAAIATALIAASVVMVVRHRPSLSEPVVSSDLAFEASDQQDPPAQIPFKRASTAGPSLWAYHQAASDSLDQLDGLLSEHAAMVLTPSQSTTHQTNRHTSKSFLEEL